MKVGTICKLKVDCLGNKAGTLGVVFYNYGDGIQAIFENGGYDGFSLKYGNGLTGDKGQSEVDLFLEEVGFEESLGDYKFKSVIQVSNDFDLDVFSIAWSEGWKKFADGKASKPEVKAFKSDEDDGFEKCEVYADGNRPAWLRFKRRDRKHEGSFTVCMLSAAMDYEDFSHFEYAEVQDENLNMFPRWKIGTETLYPKYVVFKRK